MNNSTYNEQIKELEEIKKKYDLETIIEFYKTGMLKEKSSEKKPYDMYYVNREWTDGDYPIKESLVGYNSETKKKDILLTAYYNEPSQQDDLSICEIVKSSNALWICQKRESAGVYEIVKMDVEGKNEEKIAEIKAYDTCEMWANDSNVYLLAGSYKIGTQHLYQINSNREIFDFGVMDFHYDRAKITDDYFCIFDTSSESKVLLIRNDTEIVEEYPVVLEQAGGILGSGGGKIIAQGLYRGNPAYIKCMERVRHGENPILYVLNIEDNSWEEIVLPNGSYFSYDTASGRNIFSFVEGEKDQLLIETKCGALPQLRDKNIEILLLDLVTGEQKLLFSGKASETTKNLIYYHKGFLYWESKSEDKYLVMQTDCITGKNCMIEKGNKHEWMRIASYTC
ncbi:MAG: hypothetical protein IJW18_06545 [Lachnospiraceae bacterium]|nr:hypothetical protein [Lachnospiraceae bacterium]